MIESEKCKKTSNQRPQCAKWFSRYFISKSGIWARWTSPFCRFLASFSLKYDVTDAILQDNQKMKVEYLRSLLFDLFETLQALFYSLKVQESIQIFILGPCLNLTENLSQVFSFISRCYCSVMTTVHLF